MTGFGGRSSRFCICSRLSNCLLEISNSLQERSIDKIIIKIPGVEFLTNRSFTFKAVITLLTSWANCSRELFT